MSQGAYAYRIRIADAPESWDADNASVERSKKIADTLAKCSVHVTAWKSTFLRCETTPGILLAALSRAFRSVGSSWFYWVCS